MSWEEDKMSYSNKKHEILNVAAEMFAQRGYDAVSIRDLGKAIHMTPASLYHYFSEKEQLYKETLLTVFSRIDPVLNNAREDLQGTAYLECLVHDIVAFLMRDTLFTRLLFRELSADEPERSEFIAQKILLPVFEKLASGIFSRTRDKAKSMKLADMLICSIIGHLEMARLFSVMHNVEGCHMCAGSIADQIITLLTPHMPQ